MHLYLITNKINGKQCVGMTTKVNPQDRLVLYKRKKKPKRPIDFAILKYGFDNFKFEVIFTDFDLSVDELKTKETEKILEYNSLVPNGYNVVLRDKEWMKTDSFRKASLKYGQGNRKEGRKYVGVREIEYSFLCAIRLKKSFFKTFETEIEAAKAYDKMALYLYGRDAKLNFPELIEEYLKEDLDKFFLGFSTKKYSSKYQGIFYSPDKPNSPWRAVKRIHGKDTHLRFCKTETEAAELYDQVSLYVDKDFNRLNFPEKKEEYLKQNLEEIYLSLSFNRGVKNKYPNVYHDKNQNKFRGEFIFNKKIYRCGTYSSEEEANLAVLNKKKEILCQN